MSDERDHARAMFDETMKAIERGEEERRHLDAVPEARRDKAWEERYASNFKVLERLRRDAAEQEEIGWSK